jgi:hypothetical protein
MTTIAEFRQQLRSAPLKELLEHIDLYKSLASLGVNDEVRLSIMESELERRFLAWEAAEV